MITTVAYLSLHTSPLAQPGAGDSGGMNVYIHELARTMARRGIHVDVYTRRTSPDEPDRVEVAANYAVLHVTAGPVEPLPAGELSDHVAEFAEGVIKEAYARGNDYDVVHSHYWLSGWAGVIVKEALGIPLANSFHTLGRIKDATRRSDEPASSATRLLTEDEVIAQSDCVIASTPYEAQDLMDHYDASPERLCTSPPGIDHTIFHPADRGAARSWLGLGDEPIVLFVGRIQPLKGLDVAVSAMSMLGPDVHLVAVGGPSGPAGKAEHQRLQALAGDLDLQDRVHFVPPQQHEQLAEFYRASNVLVMPSRSESFGLVAAEAQACGVPVVAAKVGGLAHIVADGESGFLVDGWDPADYARAIGRILDDPSLAASLSRGAIEFAERFSWPATADRLLELYTGITADEPA